MEHHFNLLTLYFLDSGMLQSIVLQRVGFDLATEQQKISLIKNFQARHTSFERLTLSCVVTVPDSLVLFVWKIAR